LRGYRTERQNFQSLMLVLFLVFSPFILVMLVYPVLLVATLTVVLSISTYLGYKERDKDVSFGIVMTLIFAFLTLYLMIN
jgi:hypothetical protein